MTVLVVGSMAYDTIGTPHGGVDDALGGSATYFSLAASHLTTTQLVAVVGRDFRDEDRAVFAGRDIDLGGLETVEGATFRWGGRYLANLQDRETLFTHLNVFETFSPQIPESYAQTSHVFLANIQPRLQLEVLDQMERPEFVAFDTMNLWIEGPFRGDLDALLKRVDCIIVNDEEATLLTGESNPVTASRRIQDLGPSTVLVKKGAHGALCRHEDALIAAPAMPVESVVDPTGAGDTFAGGFMGQIARSGSLTTASIRSGLVAGTVLAAECVQGFGVTALARMERADIERRAAEFVALTRLTSPFNTE
jgi:sugar/nucleoside kinase (ribokinase family)